MKTKKENTKAVTITKPNKPEKDKVAYVINDKVFGEFPVLRSANAWWMDSEKVEIIFECLKRRMSLLQASIRAKITDDQLYYFVEKHPKFSDIIVRSKEVLGIKVKEGLTTLIERVDGPTIRWYLETVESGEYGKKPPIVAVQVNMGDRVRDRKKQFQK